MKLAIQELESQGRSAHVDLERFMQEHSFPIVEGSTVTFVFRGEADEVNLLHWIHGLDSSQAFRRLTGTDLWFLIMDIPEASRVEYKLEVVRGPEHRLIQDPLNEYTARDPYGANSVVRVGHEEPDWTVEDPEARPGTLEEHHLVSDVYRAPKPFKVYLPARFRETRRYPLLVVHDGDDYLRFSALKEVLDNLIHRQEIPPMVVALTSSKNRLEEYADDPKHATFLTEELVPAMEERYPLVGQPAARGLMGASFGAVATLSCAWRHPGIFHNLLLQSGSFAFTDIGDHDGGPVFDRVVEFTNAFRRDPGRPAERIYQTCGMYEPMIYYNRSMVPLLQATGMAVRFSEARDGHNWENWRDRLREGLSWLFPGPLWMVYE